MERLLAGRYRLGDDLGAGGTARVVRATDELLGRSVAVKLLDSRIAASADPTGRERFLQECRTSAGFSHPSAVTVFDAGEDNGDLFLVMELVDGTTVAERLTSGGPLPIVEAVRVASEVLRALEAAHAVGMVHRDVKPANILLSETGVVKLADFGIAKRFDDIEESVTSTGFVVGTPRYLAPEQAMGQPVSPATDIYAVGVLLFEMLSGHPPFAGDSAVTIAVAQQAFAAPDIRTVRSDVPEPVAVAIGSALALNPDRRPATAAQLAAALAADVDGADGRAPTPTMLMLDGRAAGGADVETRLGPLDSLPHTAALHRLDANHRSTSRLVPAAVLAVVAVFLAVGYALSAGDDGDLARLAAEAETAEEQAAMLVPSVPTTVTPTAPSPSSAPVPTASTVPEVIPGFPATGELAVFLAQVERDPMLVGAKGLDLAGKLGAVLDERGKKQGDLAADLRSELSNWADTGEINSSIAGALDELLDPLARRGNDDDDDDDD